MSSSFGLFLTWTTYGTWLPGDERGYVSNTLQPKGNYQRKENRVGVDYRRDDAQARSRARQLQKGPTVWLSSEQAFIAARAVVEAACERGWLIRRGAIMTSHIHLLVENCPADGPGVRRIMKGTSQAKLSEVTGRSQKWWTIGGSNRYIHGDVPLLAVARYIEQQEAILAFIWDQIVGARSEFPG